MRHFVIVIGGGVAGAEAAHQFAQRGIRVAVLEQNTLPYGKIEYGLPKWHVKLRNKEEAAIDQKLTHPLVQYIPRTKLGRVHWARLLLPEPLHAVVQHDA